MRTLVPLALLTALALSCCARPEPAELVEPAAATHSASAPGVLTPEASQAARLLSPLGRSPTAAPLDDFPVGASTAEGVTCDLVRSFITADSALFRRCCMPAGFIKNGEYKRFLDEMAGVMDQIKAGKATNEGGPTSIKRLFKARSLSKNGPGSAGYAVFDFQAVQFVDVESPLTDGTLYTNRTLVFQLSDQSWRVMPRPDLVPMLADGLNQEPDSTQEWAHTRPSSPAIP